MLGKQEEAFLRNSEVVDSNMLNFSLKCVMIWHCFIVTLEIKYIVELSNQVRELGNLSVFFAIQAVIIDAF